MSVRRRRRPSQAPAFNFAPMVDIVLLLLVFFMTTTTFLRSERGLRVDLPTSSAASGGSAPLEVLVSASGEIGFRGARGLTPQSLESALKAAIGSDGGTVSLRADRGAQHGRVVEVMDAIKRAGASRLSVAVRERP